ncbi:MAG: hypothetical protein NZ700_15645 [Gemmataceae bacterium]|nr:hypothetical protein [Gemmataceae bacterium]MDW8264021.1 hypothetical protein [Gemmataceae bacterium]
MALYFMIWDAATFEGLVRPTLAECWRRRSFAAAVELCNRLRPAMMTFGEHYRVAVETSILAQVVAGLRFDHARWRALVGEILFFGARDIPEILTSPETLRCLLAPTAPPDGPRNEFAPIQQAHFGSRDLVFGGAIYRPEHAGWNDPTDVRRLADYLASVDPQSWSPDDLLSLPCLAGPEERADELALVRDWFPALADLYLQAARRGDVIVAEELASAG